MKGWKRFELEMKERLARNARRIRESEGFSQSDVAERAGMSLRSYQRFEEGAGSVTPRLTTVAQVAYALRVDPVELLLP